MNKYEAAEVAGLPGVDIPRIEVHTRLWSTKMRNKVIAGLVLGVADGGYSAKSCKLINLLTARFGDIPCARLSTWSKYGRHDLTVRAMPSDFLATAKQFWDTDVMAGKLEGNNNNFYRYEPAWGTKTLYFHFRYPEPLANLVEAWKKRLRDDVEYQAKVSDIVRQVEAGATIIIDTSSMKE